jgi:hypothetical protein
MVLRKHGTESLRKESLKNRKEDFKSKVLRKDFISML